MYGFVDIINLVHGCCTVRARALVSLERRFSEKPPSSGARFARRRTGCAVAVFELAKTSRLVGYSRLRLE
jgi:hypothetical protein